MPLPCTDCGIDTSLGTGNGDYEHFIFPSTFLGRFQPQAPRQCTATSGTRSVNIDALAKGKG
jgi:hypothetical protein